MRSLNENIKQICVDYYQQNGHMEMLIGTVTGVNPLEVTVDKYVTPIPQKLLFLTEAVVEKKFDLVGHSHAVTTSEGSASCSFELASIYGYDNGKQLPASGYIYLNEALKVNDIVLLLKVYDGQKFIVLSRLYNNVT